MERAHHDRSGMSDAHPALGVGMLGYAFMGKAHVNAYRTLEYMMWPPPLVPKLRSVAGRDVVALAEATARYGFERAETDWRAMVADPEVELFDNVGPNAMHAEPAIAAAAAGKHVLCEKPLGRTAAESYEMWQQVASAGVKHMCAYNYRFVPAVRLAREMIAAGEIGEIYHFRGRYLQEWIANPQAQRVWRLDRAQAGSGALGDLGAHVIDLARFVVGEITAVTGATRTFITSRPGGDVDVDDAFSSTVEFASGAIGTLEASRFCLGHKNALTWEVNGSKGSIAFDLERLNELKVYVTDNQEAHANGFRTVLVTAPEHPFVGSWWPEGHILGWEHTFVHEIHHLLQCIADDTSVAPYGATFEDGYRAAEVCDAILRAESTGERQKVSYRSLETIFA